MLVINFLKSSALEKRKHYNLNLEEGTETKRLIQADLRDEPQELTHFLLAIGKVLLNLETKLARLESVNERCTRKLETKKLSNSFKLP